MSPFRSFIIFGIFLFTSFSGAVEVSHAQITKSQPSRVEPTRIETDSTANEIRFYVDGKLAAVLKDDGLHVRNNIQFGGTIFDSGEDFHFQREQSKNDRENVR